MSKSIDSLRPRSGGNQPKKTTTPVPSGDLSGAHQHSYTEDKAQHEKADRRSWLKKHQTRILVIGVSLLIIIVGSGIFIWQKRQMDLKKGSEKTKEDAKTGLAGLDVAKSLSDADKEKLYAQVGPEYTAGQALGIAPDPASKQDQSTLTFLSNGPAGVETSAKAVLAFINSKLAAIKKNGYVEGYVYNYWYASSAVKWPESYNVPGRGSAQVLADDKKYAFDKITSDRQRLQRGEISSDQLVADIVADNRLRMFEDPNGSSKFTTVALSTNSTDKTNVAVSQAVAALTEAGIGEIKTRTYVSVYDQAKTPVEAGYFFIEARKVLKGDDAVKQYQDAVNKARGNL